MKSGTLGAIAPNERDILKRGGRYSMSKKTKGPARSSGQDLMRGEHIVGHSANTFGAYGKDDDVSRRNAAAQPQSGTSIFDPVLCELAYKWFCPKGGRILDPFSGGSVRGIVAAKLGFDYVGIDLRPEQITANEEQAASICSGGKSPVWKVGDSKDIATLTEGEFDLVFSCPPYGDLEVYSENESDLSTMSHSNFIEAYRLIIKASVRVLADDRFACFVVGDFRDKDGFYRNFVSDTIQAFQDAGAKLYNEAVLVTAVGSLPIRCGRQFDSGRKLGKTHQNVLCFFKGQPSVIKSWPKPEFREAENDHLPSPSSSGSADQE